MTNTITQIQFERIGGETRIPILQIPTNDFFEVVRALEDELSKRGLIVGRIAFRWDPEGDGRSYAITEATRGVAAVFRIYNVTPKV